MYKMRKTIYNHEYTFQVFQYTPFSVSNFDVKLNPTLNNPVTVNPIYAVNGFNGFFV